MKKYICYLLLISPIFVKAQNQDSPPKEKTEITTVSPTESGQFSLGVRNTMSLFNDEGSGIGQGAGGQFRIRVNKNVNTEWFADYITSSIGNYANRKDAHIGWSVMFYMDNTPTTIHSFTPYFLAGHCFDYTKVTENRNINNTVNRWSSAVQMGLGTHYNLTEQFDISLNAQYMIHLGKEITAHQYPSLVTEYYPPTVLITTKSGQLDLEGHLLVTLSMNYRLADLNKKK